MDAAKKGADTVDAQVDGPADSNNKTHSMERHGTARCVCQVVDGLAAALGHFFQEQKIDPSVVCPSAPPQPQPTPPTSSFTAGDNWRLEPCSILCLTIVFIVLLWPMICLARPLPIGAHSATDDS